MISIPKLNLLKIGEGKIDVDVDDQIELRSHLFFENNILDDFIEWIFLKEDFKEGNY